MPPKQKAVAVRMAYKLRDEFAKALVDADNEARSDAAQKVLERIGAESECDFVAGGDYDSTIRQIADIITGSDEAQMQKLLELCAETLITLAPELREGSQQRAQAKSPQPERPHREAAVASVAQLARNEVNIEELVRNSVENAMHEIVAQKKVRKRCPNCKEALAHCCCPHPEEKPAGEGELPPEVRPTAAHQVPHSDSDTTSTTSTTTDHTEEAETASTTQDNHHLKFHATATIQQVSMWDKEKTKGATAEDLERALIKRYMKKDMPDLTARINETLIEVCRLWFRNHDDHMSIQRIIDILESNLAYVTGANTFQLEKFRRQVEQCEMSARYKKGWSGLETAMKKNHSANQGRQDKPQRAQRKGLGVGKELWGQLKEETRKEIQDLRKKQGN